MQAGHGTQDQVVEQASHSAAAAAMSQNAAELNGVSGDGMSHVSVCCVCCPAC